MDSEVAVARVNGGGSGDVAHCGAERPAPARAPRAARTPAVAMLAMAGRLWFVVAVAGQLMFALYISVLYGGAVLSGNLDGFNTVMPKGRTPGDTLGNTTIYTHLFFAVLIILGGALQLIPQIRRRAPWLHRWTGRAYIVAAMLASLGGVYLVWVRGTVGDVTQHVGMTMNAALIVFCGYMAWRAARARDFVQHRRWAMRVFLAASGVWFFRVGLMLWLLIHRRPVGFDGDTFTGPFLSALTFGESLGPILLLQVYLWAQTSGAARGKAATAIALVVLTCAMAAGIFAATMGMWLPRMK